MCNLGFVFCVPLELFVPSFYTIKERCPDAEEQIIFNYSSYVIITHQMKIYCKCQHSSVEVVSVSES